MWITAEGCIVTLAIIVWISTYIADHFISATPTAIRHELLRNKREAVKEKINTSSNSLKEAGNILSLLQQQFNTLTDQDVLDGAAKSMGRALSQVRSKLDTVRSEGVGETEEQTMKDCLHLYNLLSKHIRERIDLALGRTRKDEKED